jgi:hypothetical protein
MARRRWMTVQKGIRFFGTFCSFVAFGVAGCGGGNGGAEEAALDSLTQRQKDSLLATMPVPGAGAVQKALDASEAARARAEAHDTIR